MPYSELLRKGLIRPHQATAQEIKEMLDLAERDLKVARINMAYDWDWAFSIAYNAILQASRAYMYSQKYRPSSIESHKNTLAFMRIALGKGYESTIDYFDRMRRKRNRTLYETAGLITETESKQILKDAAQFVEEIKRRLTQQ